MKKFVFVLLVLIFGTQCNFNEVELDNVTIENYRGLVGVPLGEITYTLGELLHEEIDSANLEVGADSIFTLVYRDSTSFSDNSQFFAVQNISNNAIVNLPATPALPQAQTIPVEENFVFSYQPENGEELDSIVYESGELSLQMVSSLNSDIDFSLDILNTVNLANNNSPVNFSGTVPANGSSQQAQDLQNHATSLSREGNLNTFQVNFSATIDLAAGQSITASDVLSFTLTYRDQEFSAVFGIFGSDNVQVGNQTVDVSFFNELGAGLIFENPEIRMVFSNSYGLPVGLLFNSIFAQTGDSNDTLFLSGQVVEGPQLIGYPTVDQVGQTIDSTLSINTTNSSIRDLFSSAPNQLGFDLRARTNPNETGERNFALNDSELGAVIEVRLPLSVRMENVTRSVLFEYGEDINLADVDSVALRIVSENQLPFNAVLNLQVLDADSLTLHAAPETLVLATPFLPLDGVVRSGEVNIANVPLSSAGIDAFQNGTFLSFDLTLNTPESLTSQEIFVDLLSQYTLELKVSIVAKLNVDF